MKKAVRKVVASFVSVLIAGCVLSVPAFSASDIPDCNGDEKADILDLISLKKAIANGKEESKYDLNRDGKVDASDCIAMRQYILEITEIHMNEDVAEDIF